jgi:hypothetical protein
MKKELDYFSIEGDLGWNQHGFRDWSMYFGGCAAVSACDLCIYLARQKGMALLYPYDADRLSREEYLAFSKTMKRYLMPRLKGIDTLHLYSSGLLHYWRDMGADSLELVKASGTVPLTEARELIREQIDSDMLVPFLLLLHKNRSFRAYQWHWFNLAGYEEREGDFYVKAITYGSFRWLSLTKLWETGHRRKGGFIRILG